MLALFAVILRKRHSRRHDECLGLYDMRGRHNLGRRRSVLLNMCFGLLLRKRSLRFVRRHGRNLCLARVELQALGGTRGWAH